MLDCRMDVVWQGAAAPATALGALVRPLRAGRRGRSRYPRRSLRML